MKIFRFRLIYLFVSLTLASLLTLSTRASADLAIWSVIGSGNLEGRVNSDVWNIDQYVYVSESEPGSSYGMTVYSGRVNANVELIHDSRGTWRAAFKVNDARSASAPNRGICTRGNSDMECGRPILTGTEGRWFKLRLWRLNPSAPGGGSTWGAWLIDTYTSNEYHLGNITTTSRTASWFDMQVGLSRRGRPSANVCALGLDKISVQFVQAKLNAGQGEAFYNNHRVSDCLIAGAGDSFDVESDNNGWTYYKLAIGWR